MRNRDPKKKQKGQESTIGKIIYGFLLFLPLLAIGVTCSYAMFNKNAYMSFESSYNIENLYGANLDQEFHNTSRWTYLNRNFKYSDSYGLPNTNNSIKVNLEYNKTYFQIWKTNVTDIIGGISTYGLGTTTYQSNTTTQIYTYNNFTYHFGLTTITYDQEYSNVYFNTLPDSNTLIFYNTGIVCLSDYYNIVDMPTAQQFLIQNIDKIDNLMINGTMPVSYVSKNIVKDLNNVFYYSIDKVQQSPLFNWAENSIIYTTTASTCNALSITTPFIPLLMSYWLIISVIYFLYDIALMLVWIIHRKIHELQESI